MTRTTLGSKGSRINIKLKITSQDPMVQLVTPRHHYHLPVMGVDVKRGSEMGGEKLTQAGELTMSSDNSQRVIPGNSTDKTLSLQMLGHGHYG